MAPATLSFQRHLSARKVCCCLQVFGESRFRVPDRAAAADVPHRAGVRLQGQGLHRAALRAHPDRLPGACRNVTSALVVPTSLPVDEVPEIIRHINIIASAAVVPLQEVKLQARAQSLKMGAMPASMTALLQDDLVDCCQPGGGCLIQCLSIACSSATAGMLTADEHELAISRCNQPPHNMYNTDV